MITVNCIKENAIEISTNKAFSFLVYVVAKLLNLKEQHPLECAPTWFCKHFESINKRKVVPTSGEVDDVTVKKIKCVILTTSSVPN